MTAETGILPSILLLCIPTTRLRVLLLPASTNVYVLLHLGTPWLKRWPLWPRLIRGPIAFVRFRSFVLCIISVIIAARTAASPAVAAASEAAAATASAVYPPAVC